MEEFNKNDWNHFHDVILNATWNTTKTKLSQTELEKLFFELPTELQEDAKEFGMNDTVWRDNVYEWYIENKM
jgi:hypothetical protein